MLVGVAVQPLAAATELFVFKLNRYICGFWSTMDVLCCTASILSLCALAWERWYGITAPLARSKRARRSKFLACCVWPVSTLVALPNALLTPPHHFDPGKLEKGCPVNVNTGYVFFSISLSFYLPAALLVVMYGCILRALAAPPPIRAHRGRSPAVNTANPVERSNSNDTGNSEDINMNILSATNGGPAAQISTSHEAFIRRQRRATRTIVTLMALFLVCWTPYFIILPLGTGTAEVGCRGGQMPPLKSNRGGRAPSNFTIRLPMPLREPQHLVVVHVAGVRQLRAQPARVRRGLPQWQQTTVLDYVFVAVEIGHLSNVVERQDGGGAQNGGDDSGPSRGGAAEVPGVGRAGLAGAAPRQTVSWLVLL